MTYPLSVQRENDRLLKALGSQFGYARYKWEWSSNVTHPMVMLDSDANIIYDYRCNCGVNVRIHGIHCQLTVPVPRVEIRSLVPDLNDQWVLVTWQRPLVSESEWITSYQHIPYPRNGSYVPVGSKDRTISIPSGSVPLPATTDLIIASILEHFLRLKTDLSPTGQQEKWAKAEKQFHSRAEDACRSAFPVHSGFPGQKEDWISGGIGESPLPLKFSGKHTAGTLPSPGPTVHLYVDHLLKEKDSTSNV